MQSYLWGTLELFAILHGDRNAYVPLPLLLHHSHPKTPFHLLNPKYQQIKAHHTAARVLTLWGETTFAYYKNLDQEQATMRQQGQQQQAGVAHFTVVPECLCGLTCRETTFFGKQGKPVL